MLFSLFLLSVPLNADNKTNVNNKIKILKLDCKSPSFILNNECWRILKEGQDCSVKPIIMELEDQPVYCPEANIITDKQTKIIITLKQREEADYLEKLNKLKTKNLKEEIAGVIAMHSYYLLGYPSGGHMIIPGIGYREEKKNHCQIVKLEGFEDPLYGKTHLAYRTNLISYASQFNQSLIEFCQ